MFLKLWKERLHDDPYQTSRGNLSTSLVATFPAHSLERTHVTETIRQSSKPKACLAMTGKRRRERKIHCPNVCYDAAPDACSPGRSAQCWPGGFCNSNEATASFFHAPISHSAVAVSWVEPLGRSIYCRLCRILSHRGDGTYVSLTERSIVTLEWSVHCHQFVLIVGILNIVAGALIAFGDFIKWGKSYSMPDNGGSRV